MKNEPAFPTEINTEHFSHPSTIYKTGMTLRDYFAAKIFSKVYEEYCNGVFRDGFSDEWRDDCAKEAYLMADSMLKARKA